MQVKPRVRQILGGLLRLALLYLLLPLLLIDLILIQTAWPRLLFDWRPFAVAATVWAAIFGFIAYRYQSRKPLIWGDISLIYAALFFVASVRPVVTVGVNFSSITLMIAFAFLAGVLSFLYRNRYSEPLLVLLPICALAWSFLFLLHQPCFVVWAILASGTGDMSDALRIVFDEATTSAITLAVVVFPTMLMYFLDKHTYVNAYGWARNKLVNKPDEEGPA